MKLMVAPSETNASFVKFDGDELPPPLLPSSTDDGYCFSCVSIEHIILYLSVIAFIIYFKYCSVYFFTNRCVITSTVYYPI